MKINYVARINPFNENCTGGGEAVMSELLRFGTGPFGCVTRLAIVTPDSEGDWMDDADLTIFCDVFNLPANKGFTPGKIKEWASSKPYVHFSNAYVDICVHDYMQCPLFEKNPTAMCNSEGVELMLGAKLLYFVSPLHMDIVSFHVPQLLNVKRAILRPTIDTQLFTNKQYSDRPVDYLYVAPMIGPKGILNVLEYLSDVEADPEKCMFIGVNPHSIPVAEGMHKTRVSYEDMPFEMNRAKVFVHLPNWPEPMGRTVIEAALCGCNLAVNGNVGATSFEFEDITDPKNYEGSIEEFWHNIEGVHYNDTV